MKNDRGSSPGLYRELRVTNRDRVFTRFSGFLTRQTKNCPLDISCDFDGERHLLSTHRLRPLLFLTFFVQNYFLFFVTFHFSLLFFCSLLVSVAILEC